VRVSVADQQLADRAGVKGVVFSLAPTGGAGGKVDVGVDYSAFAGAYGGDFGARLRLVSLPACALSKPEKRECQFQKPVLGARNDLANARAQHHRWP